MDRWRQAVLVGRLVLWCTLFWFIFDGLPHIAAWRQRFTTPPAPAKPAPPASLAVSLTVSPSTIAAGQSASLCYEVTGAEAFTLEPRPPQSAKLPKACLQVAPKETTRYTLAAGDARRSKVSRSLLLTVLPAAR